ncbi:MAG: cation:proton antiporter [Paludibacteraceae bacterium]|nr:cation:proton antiporter [Paludibacteraceae bacterium]
MTDPISIFLLVLLIILFATLASRFHVPQIIGLILAGVVLGPHWLNVLNNDQSFTLFGKVGILYIMFQVGLDVDLKTFKLQKRQGILFGAYTLFIPLLMGFCGGYLMKMNVEQSLLLSAMMACHTLLTYPVVGKMGINDNRAINIVITGTIISVTASLLIIAGVTGFEVGTNSDLLYWLRTLGLVAVFVLSIFFFVPILTRWYFKRFGDGISQYIYVLAIVFSSSLLAQAAGLEGILGAFFAGLVLNRFVKPASPLMVRIGFVGNALFIPFFLISVGLMIDLHSFVEGYGAIWIAVVMSGIALLSKFLAAFLTKLSCRLTWDEMNIIFGLTSSKAAAALAAVAIGISYGIFDESILNGTIVMILVAIVVSSFVTERSARRIAKTMHNTQYKEQIEGSGRVMISVSNPQTVRNLVEFSNLIKPENSGDSLYALKIVENDEEKLDGYKILNQASKIAAETDNQLRTVMRVDMNIPTCTITCVKEYHINDLVVGIHQKANIVDTFYGRIIKSLIEGTMEINFMIYGLRNQLSELRRMVVVVPENAENEMGFVIWLDRVRKIAQRTKMKVVFMSWGVTLDELKGMSQMFSKVTCSFLDQDLRQNSLVDQMTEHDLIVIVAARKSTVSYIPEMERIPQTLNRNQKCSFLIFYPQQQRVGSENWSKYSATKIS